jgi:uncharacterized repeat protein (TIGR01451 family)
VLFLVLAAIAWGLVVSPSRAAFPGQNGHFALISDIAGPDFDIYGFRPAPLFHVLTYTSDTFADTEMQYSADGKRVAFASARGNGSTLDVYTVNTDGSGLMQITTNAVNDTQPTFSPDGSKIAFVRQLSGSNWDIFVKNADGTGAETNLTNTPTFIEAQPAWAPNNSKIAFATNRVNNQFDIWTMNPDGTAPAVVLSVASTEAFPDYAPDSSRIAFQSNFGGNNNIFTMTTAGGSVVQLTNNAASDAIPFYSPDGTRIGFTSNRAGNNNLYTVSAAGPAESGLTQHTTSFANEVGYDWQPVFPADLAVFKSDTPDPVAVGSNVTYTLRLEHQGGGDASGVYLVDTLPTGVTFVSAPGCVHSAGVVTCVTNYIRPSQTATYTVTVKTTQTGPISNRVEIRAGQSDPDPSDNVWTEETTVRALEADLSIFKSGSPDPVNVGEDLTYTLQVANAGPDAASGVVVTDTLPAQVTFVSASAGCVHANGTVKCSQASIPQGDGVTYQIVVRPTSHGTLVNVARVTAGSGDPDPQNNTATLLTTARRIPTALEARPLVLDVLPTVVVRVGSAEARLTRADTGAPLAGELVIFTAGATELCRARTDAAGVARCTVQLAPSMVVAIANLGYNARFDGTNQFAPTSDDAPLVRVSGVIEIV